MNDNFVDFFIKKHRIKSKEEIEKEEKSQEIYREFQQKCIDEALRDTGDYDE